MSTSSDYGLTLDLIRELRRLGGTRIRIGEVEVVFDEVLARAEAAQAPSVPVDPKKEAERLMYGSSD